MRFHALIIEDDDALRELYGLYLKRGDIGFVSVSSAQAGIDILKLQSIDVILVDVNLGDGMNGLEFIKFVQTTPAYDAIKIAILTSFPNPYTISDDLRIDVSLNKPVDYARLMTALDELMNQ